MEIPDVIVVNKADHPLTDTMVREIRGVLSLGPQHALAGADRAHRGGAGRGRRGARREARARTARTSRPRARSQERRRRNLMNEVLAARHRPAAAQARGSRSARTRRCRSCSTRSCSAGSTRPARRPGCSSASSSPWRAGLPRSRRSAWPWWRAGLDARLNPYEILGLAVGEAHIIRNAGGVVTEDAIRSLAISQRVLDTQEIIILQHTDCGLLGFDCRTRYPLSARLARSRAAGCAPNADHHIGGWAP